MYQILDKFIGAISFLFVLAIGMCTMVFALIAGGISIVVVSVYEIYENMVEYYKRK